jgi:hypothetical protein
MATTILGAQQLAANETWQGDYTHKHSVTYLDLQALAAGVTSQVYTVETPVAVGKVVCNPALYVVTPFVFSDGTILTATESFGDGGSATQYLPATNIQGAGATSPVTAGFCAAAAVVKAYTAASNLNVTIAVTAAKNLNTATAGEVFILWQERQLAELGYPQQ